MTVEGITISKAEWVNFYSVYMQPRKEVLQTNPTGQTVHVVLPKSKNMIRGFTGSAK